MMKACAWSGHHHQQTHVILYTDLSWNAMQCRRCTLGTFIRMSAMTTCGKSFTSMGQHGTVREASRPKSCTHGMSCHIHAEVRPDNSRIYKKDRVPLHPCTGCKRIARQMKPASPLKMLFCTPRFLALRPTPRRRRGMPGSVDSKEEL